MFFIEKALGESFSGLKRKEGELRPAYSLLLLCSGLGSRRDACRCASRGAPHGPAAKCRSYTSLFWEHRGCHGKELKDKGIPTTRVGSEEP